MTREQSRGTRWLCAAVLVGAIVLRIVFRPW
jgi:hypothetical protein